MPPNKLKLMSLVAKLMGNPALLKDDCTFQIVDNESGKISGTFEVRGELAKELGEFLGKENG